MPDLGEHFRKVASEQTNCGSDHADDFAGLIAEYHTAEGSLTDQLAADITPERIFVGGKIDPIGTLVIDSDEYDPDVESDMPPYASVERWAVDGARMVQVSKMVLVGSSEVLGFLENRWKFVPGIATKRMQKIIDSVLAAPHMTVKEFNTPEVIDDAVLETMRAAAQYPPTRATAPDAISSLRPIEVTDTGPQLFGLRGNKTMLPESLVDISDDMVRFGAFMFMSAEAVAALPEDKRQERLDHSHEYLIHDGGWHLWVASNSLQRAASVVRNGRLVTPTKPQNDVKRWPAQFFDNGLERRLRGA